MDSYPSTDNDNMSRWNGLTGKSRMDLFVWLSIVGLISGWIDACIGRKDDNCIADAALVIDPHQVWLGVFSDPVSSSPFRAPD